ncbi:ankyrin [Piedraia hortae CBS 480.64]|uniref:Ankyrin n=1 Tax=Piedraia hortae CBS 480.64 TaxID=1314780 RepID=A0A6A7BVR0_9PEZI|nr:ankyrin [Piedraia hortae CBS 480.64]
MLCEEGSSKRTVLMHAVERNEEDIIDLLFKNAPRVNVNICDDKGLTALHIAAGKGNSGIARLLIKHSANMEAEDKFRETPIFKAVEAGKLELAK